MSETTEVFDEIEERARELLTLIQGLRLDYAIGNIGRVRETIKKLKENIREINELLNEL